MQPLSQVVVNFKRGAYLSFPVVWHVAPAHREGLQQLYGRQEVLFVSIDHLMPHL